MVKWVAEMLGLLLVIICLSTVFRGPEWVGWEVGKTIVAYRNATSSCNTDHLTGN